ncbi:hypothetical protein AC249_AIPGENE26533 [Exaiptasia diaphana]|nr:hypothetical protein AC249_AIPGENE26533 [Exaiptasia diaphana]
MSIVSREYSAELQELLTTKGQINQFVWQPNRFEDDQGFGEEEECMVCWNLYGPIYFPLHLLIFKIEVTEEDEVEEGDSNRVEFEDGFSDYDE